MTYPTTSQRIAAKLLKALRTWKTASEAKREAELGSHKTANAYLQLWTREGILDTRLRDDDKPHSIVPSEYRLKTPSKWGEL
jgi:hypothetical protein